MNEAPTHPHFNITLHNIGKKCLFQNKICWQLCVPCRHDEIINSCTHARYVERVRVTSLVESSHGSHVQPQTLIIEITFIEIIHIIVLYEDATMQVHNTLGHVFHLCD